MWTVEQVAERFREAAETARRLPPVRVQGYFNLWPPIQRQPIENGVDLEAADYRFRLGHLSFPKKAIFNMPTM